MQPIQPDQATFLLHGIFLPGVKNEHRLNKAVIEAIPLDKGDYRPDEISKTALELAWHITVTEMRFLDAVAAGAFDFSRPLLTPSGFRRPHLLVRCQFRTRVSRLQTLQRPAVEDRRLPRMFQLPAVMYLLSSTTRSSQRTVVDVSPPDGRQGSRHLRRELRFRCCPEG